MKRLTLASFALLSVLIGCGTSTAPTSTSAVRKYNGTASVGDFLTISLDSNAHTIEYVNHTNGDSGTVPYTVNVDGTYTVIDPQGNLLTVTALWGTDFFLLPPIPSMSIQTRRTGC